MTSKFQCPSTGDEPRLQTHGDRGTPITKSKYGAASSAPPATRDHGQVIHRRRPPVRLSKVVIEEVYVTSRDFERRGAMAEDPLQAKYVTAIG
jgi:hypothetical protein